MADFGIALAVSAFGNHRMLSALGILLGLPLSVAGLVFVTSEFAQELPVSTPLLGVVIAVAVMSVALVATWLPARRAAGLDPLVAMRVE